MNRINLSNRDGVVPMHGRVTLHDARIVTVVNCSAGALKTNNTARPQARSVQSGRTLKEEMKRPLITSSWRPGQRVHVHVRTWPHGAVDVAPRHVSYTSLVRLVVQARFVIPVGTPSS
jgi:prophage tail gpP-like protein